MYFWTIDICVLKCTKLVLQNLFQLLELSWHSLLRKTKVKLDLLTDIDMLLMVKKLLEEEYKSTYWSSKANNKYIKDYDKNKESSCLKFWDLNNLYGWEMWQKLPLNNFQWIEDTSQFSEDFIKQWLQWRKWWRIISWSRCSTSWKIAWPWQWVAIFNWKNENWKKSKCF